MKDERLWKLKLRAEKDRNLSDGANRSLALIISDRYMSTDLADADFPLSWSSLSRLHGGLSRSTAERRIEELVQCGYLKRDTLKGCPATWWFFIVFRCVKNEASTYSNRPPTGRVTNGASGCRENGAHHISNSFQEKIIKERSVGAATAAGAAAPTQRPPIPPARVAEFIRELHEAVESPK